MVSTEYIRVFRQKGGSVHVLTRIVDYEAFVGIQY